MAMKIEQMKGRLLLKKPKIVDPSNETETIKDVMLVDGKIDEIGIIDTENDFNFIDINQADKITDWSKAKRITIN